MSDASTNISCHSVSKGYEKDIKTLKKELFRERKENQRLHDICRAAHLPTDDWDSEVTLRFETLKRRIQQFAGAHLGEFKDCTEDYPFSIMKDSDRNLFLKSSIADFLHGDLFMVGSFGLDGNLEECLQTFEHRLEHRKVPTDEIVAWRAATIKVAKNLVPSGGRPKALQYFAADLHEFLDAYVVFKEGAAAAALSEIEALYGFAYDLAMRIRESKTVYQWRQWKHQRAMVEADLIVYPGYHRPNGHGGFVPHTILFGSVHKLIDQDRVVIQKGELLIPSRNSEAEGF